MELCRIMHEIPALVLQPPPPHPTPPQRHTHAQPGTRADERRRPPPPPQPPRPAVAGICAGRRPAAGRGRVYRRTNQTVWRERGGGRGVREQERERR